MRRDSDLAEKIMRQMVRTTGIVPLPVHDSFIVPSALEGKLRETMESASPCRTESKIPCRTDPQNGDNFLPVNPTSSPKNDLQYGTDTVALPLDGWVVVGGPVVGWLHYGVRTGDVVEWFGSPGWLT